MGVSQIQMGGQAQRDYDFDCERARLFSGPHSLLPNAVHPLAGDELWNRLPQAVPLRAWTGLNDF